MMRMRLGSFNELGASKGILGPGNPVIMFRRISTKLVLAVLTTAVLPFVAFSFYMNEEMGERLTRNVVHQALLGLAKDLATQVDSFIWERHRDVAFWAGMPLAAEAINEYQAEVGELRQGQLVEPWDAQLSLAVAKGESPAGFREEAHINRAVLSSELDRFIKLKGVYEVALLIAADGHLVASSTWDRDMRFSSPDYMRRLFERDFSDLPWFEGALGMGREGAGVVWPSPRDVIQVDQHISEFRPQARGESLPVHYSIGFSSPVYRSKRQPGEVLGVLYVLTSWDAVQELTRTSVVQDAFRGLVEDSREPSPYAWIWGRDGDTIIGHKDVSLYGKSISNDIKLPELSRAVKESESGWGLYPEYTFGGKKKNAAFRRCAPPRAQQGPDQTESKVGFGWVIGVGIDNDDIYATSSEIRSLLMRGTALTLLLAVGWTFYIARRTTTPILELQEYARRVATGDLDVRIDVRSRDELGALAEDFNLMTQKLKAQQEHIVKSEKDAAWREMARQIAHDIKNPLTPIRLSLDLLARARKEEAPGLEEILDRTLELIRRQVIHLQEIAAEFYHFTGGGVAKISEVDCEEMLNEVLRLHDAWAVELGVELQQSGDRPFVLADEGKLRRVFVNLLSNALQAMPEGGKLWVESRTEGDRLRVSFTDSGRGLEAEAREHLFEPYFTTKTEGTGLGLAISKQAMEQMAGAIELKPRDQGHGTEAVVWIPLAAR